MTIDFRVRHEGNSFSTKIFIWILLNWKINMIKSVVAGSTFESRSNLDFFVGSGDVEFCPSPRF